ncbi:hypothetical protein HY086_05355 [Candidatus Gottesmanbacteria bacterium]|nr:hypothetical protein [Candidatus Gottesmanbacteria bacterium]
MGQENRVFILSTCADAVNAVLDHFRQRGHGGVQVYDVGETSNGDIFVDTSSPTNVARVDRGGRIWTLDDGDQ